MSINRQLDRWTLRCTRLLWVLLATFALRVAAQFIQFIHHVPVLPDFDRWQGSALPYPALLAAQLLIVWCGAALAWRVGRGWRGNRRLGAVLLVVGTVYFATMAVRLGLGVTVLEAHPWFSRPLPAVFHLVLAAFLVVLGLHHRRTGEGRA